VSSPVTSTKHETNAKHLHRIPWWATLRQLWPYQQRYWPLLLIATVLLGANILFEVGSGVIQSVFFSQMRPGHIPALLRLIRDCMAVGMGIIILSAVQHYCRSVANAYSGRAFARATLRTIERIPFAWLQRFHSGDLVSRVINDSVQANNLLSALLFEVFYQVLLGVIALFYLLGISKEAAIAAIVVGPILFVLGRFFDRRIRAISEDFQAKDAAIRARVQESLQEMTAIRAYGLEARTIADFTRERQEQNRLTMRRAMMQSAMWQLVMLAQGSAQVIAAVLVAERALHGAISAGQVMTFVFLMNNVQQPFMRMSRVWNEMQQSLGAGDRLRRLDKVPQEPVQERGSTAQTDASEKRANRKPDAPNAATPGQGVRTQPLAAHDLPPAVPAISIAGVTFSPGQEDAMADWQDPSLMIQGIDGGDSLFTDLFLTVYPGETLALVGPSGAGKTSLVRLMCGLFRPERGEVCVAGVSMKDDPVRARRYLSYVPQNPHLFSGTIRENIAFGMENATDEAIWQAARQAQVHDFVQSLDDGYGTLVGEQGQRLSGGQRQRLALARALLRDTPILLLDEPTSALDNETERAIQMALEDISRTRTLVIIAHRLSTIRSADRIVVLERGRIVEEGRHTDLLAAQGTYARLAKLQMA